MEFSGSPGQKKDQSGRPYLDYRKLNAIMKRNAYPLPRVDESLDALLGSVYFSKLDLFSGYWQVPLSKDVQEKAVFMMRESLWTWKVLPFRLTSTPASFERLLERVLKRLR